MNWQIVKNYYIVVQVAIQLFFFQGCGGSSIDIVDGKDSMNFFIGSAYSDYLGREKVCNQPESIITGHYGGIFPSPICVSTRVYNDMIFYYPSLNPVVGNTVAAGQLIVCYPLLGNPTINPSTNNLTSSRFTWWKKSVYLNPPNRYEPVNFFRQEDVYDSSGKLIGVKLYTSNIQDNFLVCAGEINYRIIEVI